MIRTMFLVPERDNEGEPFTPGDWKALHETIIERFGGYTRRPGAEGAWRSGGRIYHDVSYEYVLSLASLIDVPSWLDLVRWVRTRFRQEAIYVELGGIAETIGDR